MRRWIIGLVLGMWVWSAAPADGAKTPTPTPVPTPSREKPAQDAAAAWLALVDAGQYGESWDAAAELFKKSVTRAQWIDALTKVRSPLGRLESRRPRASVYLTDLPGAPTGDYVVIEFDSSFAGGSAMIERVTPMKDPDGTWRVSGYYVVPAK